MASKEQTKTKKPVTKAKTQSKKSGDSKEKYQDVKKFVHPAETWWGKAVVWVLVFGMVGFVVVAFILAIINSQA